MVAGAVGAVAAAEEGVARVPVLAKKVGAGETETAVALVATTAVAAGRGSF